ncbi:mucoidy inhibitor MuiA family protein [Geomonas sp.]|uniref:mucoidy inhibitor MuiA family protein n=1 Tax=Geomonas sp. TaxID=2651584 RepID=UPI002B478092|nr:mucoidy inhibitor MuiA family protein [Geomonas sp.]HJV36700.1 mucoidy inhibitor MuiA family protein [Geomonas sp.]
MKRSRAVKRLIIGLGMLATITPFALPAMVSPAVASERLSRIKAAPRITAVTVYPDRAMTTRSTTLSLKPGNYLVSFEGLPALLQDDSVRVSGKGSAGTTIVGLEVKRAFTEQVPEKRAAELEKEIRQLKLKVAGIEAKKAALVAENNFIASIKVAWGDRISKELAVGRPTSAELNEALTFVASGVRRVEQESRDLDEEKRQLDNAIDKLRREREESMGSRQKETKNVEVNVEVTREGRLELELTSVTPQASWEPCYDARLASDGKSAELVFRALVRQQTGEDWHDVSLSLSTARPALGGAPPELSPWLVSFYRPLPSPMPASPAAYQPLQMMRAGKTVSSKGSLVEYDAEAPAEAPASYLTAQLDEEQNSVSFLVPRTVDIPADDTRHGNVVATENLPLTLEFLAVPKLSPGVFLRSEIVNRAPYPLLPGRVNVFTGGNYHGSTQLKKVASGEKFDLFFGTDDQVTVKREEIKSHKEAGLFGKNRMAYRYRIELQNFRKEAQTITVRDQLPTAGDQEIKVTLDEPSMQPTEQKPDGTLSWKLPVLPGEKKAITFDIVVEYPKDREVTGL